MTLWVTCFVVCCVTSCALVNGAPAISSRRSSRDLDKIDGLRARLLRLQEQLKALEDSHAKTAEHVDRGRETGSHTAADDVSAEDDISKLQEGTEAQMASGQQQLMRKLARTLDGDSDLRNLANTLSQMLKETTDKGEDGAPANSYGEYLGDTEYTDGYRLDGAKFNVAKEEEKRGEASKDDLDVEIDDKRLKEFYNILMRLYNEQQAEEAPQQGFISESSHSDSSHSMPLVHIDEGSFGAFVGGVGKRPSHSSSNTARRPSAPSLRDVVLSAVERKLLGDIQEASEAGISVDDIIRDLRRQAGTYCVGKHGRLRDYQEA